MRTPLLELVSRLLFLPMLMVALAFLVTGYASTGGGFAAGAIAGVAVLLRRTVAGEAGAGVLSSRHWRLSMLSAGLLVLLVLAFGTTLAGGVLLTHLPRPGQPLTTLGAVELHTSLIFETGVALVVFAFVLEAVALVAPGQGARQ